MMDHDGEKKETTTADLTPFKTNSSSPGVGTVHPAGPIDLEDLGIEPSTEKNLSGLDIFCAGWNICNSWCAVAATLAIAIAQGGTVTLIYGILVVILCDGCVAATLSELASVYPTAGGQYHWTSILAPKKYSSGLSYCCGIINVFSWIAICVSVAILPAQGILALAIAYHPGFVAQAWHYFVLYQFFNFAMLFYNIFALRRSIWIYDVGFVISIAGLCAIFITCLATSTEKQPSSFVWTTFINESGWSSGGVVFLTGLITPNYMFCGIDGAIHLAEQCSNAAVAVPRALMTTIAIGGVTAFSFTIAMLYSISDFDAVLMSPTGFPIFEVWKQATHSETAATIFLVLLLCLAALGQIGCQQTASRLTWSFARDNATFLSKHLAVLHPTLKVPVNALLFNSFLVFVIGCIYLASTTAFNALIGTSLVLQHVSFAMPAALLLYRRRSSRYLPPGRSFSLGRFGWVANSVTVGFGLLILVFYDMPVTMPVTGSSMNYASVVIGCMALFAVLDWFLYSKKHYHGPRLSN